MRWAKRGLIIDPTERAAWMQSHAAYPVAHHISGSRYRVYCSGRDDRGRAQVGYFEIDLRDPTRMLAFSERPVLALGPLGGYEDSGVLNSCIVQHEGLEYHYYAGLTLGVTVPFYFYVGLATSDDGGVTLRRRSNGPLLERNDIDPYLTGSCWVMKDEERWRLWYTSGVRWTMRDGKPRHYYHIKYAESDDGIHWRREGTVAIDFVGDEHVIARPCVIRDGDLYRMWYSYRGAAYRIGYAESTDGIRWTRRDDQVGIDVSSSGWDANMIEYAHVFDHDGQRYMLYNGDGYARTGIGLAILSEG